MIDCSESDIMIEMCEKLDKSNTLNRFRGEKNEISRR